jgi:predicted permease
MRQLRAACARIVGLFTGRRRTAAFDAELESHIELHVEHNVGLGMTPGEARRQALIALGGVQATREAYRDRGGFPVLDTLGQDVRFAFRMLRKAPGFTAAAVLILALGIGANGAVFSLINILLLKPVVGTGVDDAMVGVYSGDTTRPDVYRPFSYPEYLDLRDRNTVFAHLLAESSVRTGITDAGRTRRIDARLVSSNYFTALQVPMAEGRGFTPEEEHPLANAAVAVVSHAFWRRRGSTPLVGRHLLLNGREFTVIGIAPEWFHGTMAVMATELWVPFGATRLLVPADERGVILPVSTERSTPALLLNAVLRDGITPDDAQARLVPIAGAMAAAYPEFNRHQRLVVQKQSRTGRSSAPRVDTEAFLGAGVMMAIAGMVLVVACLNLANMLLARGGARRQEIAVRLALGGSRWRIVRQLVIEGLLLAILGSAVSFGFVWLAARQFVESATKASPVAVAVDPTPDIRVIAIVLATAIASTLLFSLGPAWRMSRPQLSSALRPSGPLGTGRTRLPGILVGAQIALSLALLIGAGLCMRAGARAAVSDPGFPLAGGLMAQVDTTLIGLAAQEGRGTLLAALARIRELDGVRDASFASIVPFGDVGEARLVRRDGNADTPPAFATYTVVGSRYFTTMGFPILAGRDFTGDEEAGTHGAVAIVDRLLAEQLFGAANPIGRLVHIVDRDGGIDDSLQIVGVVPSVRDDVDDERRPHLYVPFGRSYRMDMTFHARVDPPSEARMLEAIRQAIRGVDDRLPIASLRTMTQHRDATGGLWGILMVAGALATFGAIALALATVGVYGLRAYLVSRRTGEIGIRIALGATRQGLVWQLLRESTRVAAVGSVIGVALALGLAELLRQSGILLDVNPLDPFVYGAAALTLAVTTTLASYLPARRVLRIDPSVALRPE